MNKVTAILRYCLIIFFFSLSESLLGQFVDLELNINVSPPTYTLYGTNIGIITVSNQGNTTATNVQVKIPFPTGLVYSTHVVDQGTFEPFGGVWDVGDLDGGQSTHIEISYFVTRNMASITIFGQVTAVDQLDPDSSPNNAIGSSVNEDDESAVQLFPQGQAGGGGSVVFSQFPSNRQLFTRDRATNKATINIEGTVSSDNYEKIRLKIFRNNSLASTLEKSLLFSAGSATFNLQVDIEAERVNYRLEAYAVIGRSEILLSTADEIVAGDVIIINGQSNAEARAAAYPTDYDDFLRSYTDDAGWDLLNRSFPGQWGARLGKAITIEQGIPVAIFNQAVGAQQIPFYLKDDSDSLAGNYGKLLQRLRNAGVEENVLAAFWFHGEADGWTTSINEYKQHFTDIYNDWINDYQVAQVYLYQIRFNSCSHPFPLIMEAHRQLGAELPQAETMSTTNANHDGCHYEYFDGYEVLGNRMYGLVKRDFYNGTSMDVSAPDVDRIIKSGAQELTIEMKNAGSGLQVIGTPWVDFKLEGSAVRILNGQVSGNKIILELDGDPAGATGLSYLGHSGLTPSWITLNNGVGALTFYNFPICFSCGGGTVPKADLSLSLSTNKVELESGETFSYTLTVTNSGPDQTNSVEVNFTLPNDIIFQNSNGNYNPATGKWIIGNLNNGSTSSITINAIANLLNPQTFHFAQITNSSLLDPDSTPNNDQGQTDDEDDEASLILLAKNSGGGGNTDEADLSLNMVVVPTQLRVYDFIYFTITLHNDGPATATNIVVSNPLPANTVFTAAHPTIGNYNPWNGNWEVSSLASGEAAQLELQLYVLSDATPVTNFAQVIAVDQPDPDSAPNNNASNTPTEDDEAMIMIDKNGSSGGGGGQSDGPDLELSLGSTNPDYQQYQSSDFSLTVVNTGNEPMTEILIRFDYPEDFVFVQASPEKGNFEPWLQEWQVGILAAGESVTMDIQLYALAASGARIAFAEVIAANPTDVDSSPGNGNGVFALEDDEAALELSNVADIRAGRVNRDLVTSKNPLHLTLLYPNPAEYELNIQIESWDDRLIDLILTDGFGRALKSYPLTLDKGKNLRRIDLTQLPGGTYYLSLPEANRRKQQVKFVKVRE